MQNRCGSRCSSRGQVGQTNNLTSELRYEMDVFVSGRIDEYLEYKIEFGGETGRPSGIWQPPREAPALIGLPYFWTTKASRATTSMLPKYLRSQPT